MSAGGPGVIGPVSVRYAAQIRELLFARALQRMVADQEAARAEAVRSDAATKADPAPQSPSHKAAENVPQPRPVSPAAGLVDIQA